MMSLRAGRLEALAIPSKMVWTLSEISRLQGQLEEPSKRLEPFLQPLVDSAQLDSVEASCRLDGLPVAAKRLRTLLREDSPPASEAEAQWLGYRQALLWIRQSSPASPLTPSTLQQLHALALPRGGQAEPWMREGNAPAESSEGLHLFRPVSARHAASAVEHLCQGCRQAAAQHIPLLLIQAASVLDFLAISPFRRANGRVSRLLALLGWHRDGIPAAHYVSLESQIEKSRQDYRKALQASLKGWHQGEHDLQPWLSYFLQVTRQACLLFEKRAASAQRRPGVKRALVESAVKAMAGPFTRRQLQQSCPGVSPEMLRRVLKDLKKEGRVACLGKGPGAPWRKRGDWQEGGRP